MTWLQILNNMDSIEYRKAKDIGCAAASLVAMINRGYVEKLDTAPAKYRKTTKAKNYIAAWTHIYANPNDGYYDFYKAEEPFGMMCKTKKNDIIDCFDNIWDLDGLTGVLVWRDGKAHRVPFEELY